MFNTVSCLSYSNYTRLLSWMRDNKTVSHGVINLPGRSVLQFIVKKDSTVICSAKDQDGVTSKQAKLTVIGTVYFL